MEVMRSLYWFFNFCFLLLFCCGQEKSIAGDLLKTEYSYQRYTLHDGLPDMKLNCLHLDDQGFIWIGTTCGFTRFDGFSFSFFQPNEQKNIIHITSNNKGNTIFQGYRYAYSLSQYDSIQPTKLMDTLYLNPNNTKNLHSPYLIYENMEGNHKYLMRFDNDSLVDVPFLTEIQDIENNKVYFDEFENTWYIPTPEGVYIYQAATGLKHFLKGLVVESFLNHSSLGIIAFGQDGIYNINNENFTCLVNETFDQNLTAMEHPDGSIIFFDFHILYRYTGGKLETLAELSMITDMMTDNDGNLWVSTFTGLYNFFRLDFKNYSLKNSDVIMTVVEDDNDDIYFGTLQGNLICKTAQSEQKVTYPSFGGVINSFGQGALAANHCLYFPSPAGLLIKDKHRFSMAKIPPFQCRKIETTTQGNILFTLTYNGIYECDRNGDVVHHLSTSELKQQPAHSLYDASGRLLVFGMRGISLVGDSIRLLQNNNTVDSYVACASKEGDVWFGSANHLNLLRGDSIITVHTFQNDMIKSMLLLDMNFLLLGNIQGIYLFDINAYNTENKVQLLYYGHQDGMTMLDPHMYGLYLGKNGMVWMPASDGVVAFDPRRLIRKTSPPKFYIQSSETSDDNVHWKRTEIEDVILSHRYRNVRFSFIGLKYSAVEKVRYSYRLKGFQEEWSKPLSVREATFNNLRPGNYIFEAYTDAGTDDSRSEIRQVRFSIRPAFWQTWWFVSVVVLLLILASTGVALYIQRRKNIHLIERLETEKQLNELRVKSIRLRSIPHFNANVLAAIEYYVMNLSKDEANRLLNIYSEFTSRTLREVDKASRSLNDELDYVKMYLKLEKLRFMEKFNYEVDIEPGVKQDVQLPNMILHTYCENAVKHGFSGRLSDCLLKISARQKDDMVEVCVEDNGVGRIAAEQNKNIRSTKQGLDILTRQIEIYNRFNKKKITQRIVDLYDGDIPIGTRFMIEVPYGFIYQ